MLTHSRKKGLETPRRGKQIDSKSPSTRKLYNFSGANEIFTGKGEEDLNTTAQGTRNEKGQEGSAVPALKSF
jgi:hypothetical protein